jgi:nucleotide-binding universal stress UspA family protein
VGYGVYEEKELPGEAARAVATYLQQIRSRLETAGIPVACDMPGGRRPAERIVERACDLGADLIVMSTRGQGGYAPSGCGRVAREVLRTASCPVLLISVDTHEVSLDSLPTVSQGKAL